VCSLDKICYGWNILQAFTNREIILNLFEMKGMRLDAREILNLNKQTKKKNLWLAFGIATWEGLINEYFLPGIFALLLY